ncbi:MAG: hypothetical protein WA584_16030 [Pyrinomonadaceae bacterium]
MIEKSEQSKLNPGEAQSELKPTVNLDNSVSFGWKKADFDLLELQWRKAGTEMRQHADKSNVSPLDFAPPLTTLSVPDYKKPARRTMVADCRAGDWVIFFISAGGNKIFARKEE